MLVEGIRREDAASGRVRWSARVGGEELFFEVDAPAGERHANPADSFAAMALGPAMLRGEPLTVVGEPVSAELARNLPQIQTIWNTMNPRYRKVPLELNTREGEGRGDGVSMLFSAGVDSMAVFQKHEEELDSCVMICGFDMEMEPAAVERSIARNRALMERRGKELRVVVSNQLRWGLTLGLHRPFVFTSYLVGSAYFFAPRRLLIASAMSYADRMWDGALPHVDPLWSNGTTQVVHAGADLSRARKLERVAEDDDLLRHLRVCFYDQNENCGRCEKCIRTMTGLRILGEVGPFPRVLGNREIRRSRIGAAFELQFAIDNLLLAVRWGDQGTAKALRSAIRRYDRGVALRAFDRGFLGGGMKRILRTLRPRKKWDGPVFPSERPDLEI